MPRGFTGGSMGRLTAAIVPQLSREALLQSRKTSAIQPGVGKDKFSN
jgi:hypothetical protein